MRVVSRFFLPRYVTTVPFPWSRTRRSFAKRPMLAILCPVYVDYDSYSRDTVLFECLLGQSLFRLTVDAPFAASSSSDHSDDSRRLHPVKIVRCFDLFGIDPQTATSRHPFNPRRFSAFANHELGILGIDSQAASSHACANDQFHRFISFRVRSQAASSSARCDAFPHVVSHVGSAGEWRPRPGNRARLPPLGHAAALAAGSHSHDGSRRSGGETEGGSVASQGIDATRQLAGLSGLAGAAARGRGRPGDRGGHSTQLAGRKPLDRHQGTALLRGTRASSRHRRSASASDALATHRSATSRLHPANRLPPTATVFYSAAARDGAAESGRRFCARDAASGPSRVAAGDAELEEDSPAAGDAASPRGAFVCWNAAEGTSAAPAAQLAARVVTWFSVIRSVGGTNRRKWGADDAGAIGNAIQLEGSVEKRGEGQEAVRRQREQAAGPQEQETQPCAEYAGLECLLQTAKMSKIT